MKIPLSAVSTAVFDPILRPISDSKTSLLMMNLLIADTNSDYRVAATDIRNHLAPVEDVPDQYPCIHPEWFDSEIEVNVDATTCNFCGYRNTCTLGNDEREFVDIINLDNSRIPSQKFIQDNCFKFDNLDLEIVGDPFFGFSSRAGESRKLFLISQKEFTRQFPERYKSSIEFDLSVGYDRMTGQSLWAHDRIFLEQYEQISSKIKFELNNSNRVSKNELSMFDEQTLMRIAFPNKWLVKSDLKIMRTQLCVLFSRFISKLRSKQIRPYFLKITQINMIPKIDTPHHHCGSGDLNLVIRWLELKPTDLTDYIEKSSKNKFYKIQKELVNRIINKKNTKLLPDFNQYIPRFPAIAFSPEALFPSIKLEQSSCRVIDVIESPVEEVLLLIDGLGIDLLGEMNFD